MYQNRLGPSGGIYYSNFVPCFVILYLNKLFTVMGGKFKFQVQDSDLEYLFWQCEKHITLSEKNSPLAEARTYIQ